MKTWHKVVIGVGAVVVIDGIVMYSANAANKGVVTVQTLKVTKQDALVFIVTATGDFSFRPSMGATAALAQFLPRPVTTAISIRLPMHLGTAILTTPWNNSGTSEPQSQFRF